MCGSLLWVVAMLKRMTQRQARKKLTATIKVWGCAEDQADENGKWLPDNV